MAAKLSNELLKKLLIWTGPGILVLGLTCFVVASTLVGFFPETFGPIFSGFISYEGSGLYADCTLAKNRNNRICNGIAITQASEVNKSRTWNSIQKSKKPLPFTLHGN